MNLDLSVVVPLRDEAPNARPLHEELTATLGAAGFSYEIIVVDDGSVDATFDEWAALQAADPHVRVIRFRRNFGQTAAFAAGFAHARGRLVVTLDGDLQNDPRDIPAMVRLVEQGADLVCGWRKDRQDTFLTRRVPSVAANWLISRVTGVRLHDYGCSLKVFRSELVKSLRLHGDMHRFLPALCIQFDARITEVVVNHRARQFGHSKYGLSRTFRVVRDIIALRFVLKYSSRPTAPFGALGRRLAARHLAAQSQPLYVIGEVRETPDAGTADVLPLQLQGRKS